MCGFSVWVYCLGFGFGAWGFGTSGWVALELVKGSRLLFWVTLDRPQDLYDFHVSLGLQLPK